MAYFPFKIYCDMDGVLVDFEKGAVAAINAQLSSQNPKFPHLAAQVIKTLGRNYVVLSDIKKYDPSKVDIAAQYMYTLLEDDEKWWATLPWMEDGERLWTYIRQFNPQILTSPMDKGGKSGSLAGKRRWVAEHLKISPDRIIFKHDKWEKAISEHGKRNILIDDFAAKIDPWIKAGGIGILHLNTHNTISILQMIEKTREAP